MNLTTHTCPHCSASLAATGQANTFSHCESCFKPYLIATPEGTPEIIEAIPAHVSSAVTTGNRGRYKDLNFKVTGCILLYQSGSVFTFHCLAFANGKTGYLFEWFGNYCLIDSLDTQPPVGLKNSQLTKLIDLNDKAQIYCHYLDKVDYIGLSGTGHLFFYDFKRTVFCAYYNKSGQGHFGLYSHSVSCLLTGEYLDYESLNLVNNIELHKLNKDTDAILKPENYQCPDCKNQVNFQTRHLAINVVCQSCGCIIRFNNKREAKSLKKIKDSKTTTFKLGTEFEIDGSKFLLINYQIKEEANYKTKWTEFTLYNPIKGSLILNESDGHYVLLAATRFFVPGNLNQKMLTLADGSEYNLYSKYRYKTVCASGEFLIDCFGSGLPSCGDFVCPPYMLSFEKSSNEIAWYKGEYCNHKKVKSWLKDPVSLPPSEGIAPSQPFLLNFNLSSLYRITLLAGIILSVLFFISTAGSSEEQVFSQTYFEEEAPSGKTVTSPAFNITANNKAAQINFSSMVSNSWLDVDFTLVNETTGDQYYFSRSMEKYYGIEDGESWSEGDNSASIVLSSLKAGRYHFNMTLNSSGSANTYKQLAVFVAQDVPITLNFFVFLLILLIFPAFLYARKKMFDKNQWYDSIYSPYNYD